MNLFINFLVIELNLQMSTYLKIIIYFQFILKMIIIAIIINYFKLNYLVNNIYYPNPNLNLITAIIIIIIRYFY